MVYRAGALPAELATVFDGLERVCNGVVLPLLPEHLYNGYITDGEFQQIYPVSQDKFTTDELKMIYPNG